MKKSLLGTLAAIAIMIGAMFLVLKKGALGAAWILLPMALLLLVVSVLTGFYGKKVQDRDRHP